MLTLLTIESRAFDASARRRSYLAAFVILAATFCLMALRSPQGAAEVAIFLTVAQLAALMAGLAVYVRVLELPASLPTQTVAQRPKSGRPALQESLAVLLKVADIADRPMDVAVMLIESDQAEPVGRGSTHAFERLKLALKARATQAEVIELSEDCVALTLAGTSASYELEAVAHSLLRDLRDFKQNEMGMASLNLTFGVGVCSGERSDAESLMWQARVALRRAYDLKTGIYVISNRSNLAKRF